MSFAGCAERLPSPRTRGDLDENESEVERVEIASEPELAERELPQPESQPPQPESPNSAEAVTPSSVTWRWGSEGTTHRLFIRRRGDARCDIDGLACRPSGRLQDSEALFERLDRIIAVAFPQMQPGPIPIDVSGEFQGVQVVLANAESRHALLRDDSAPLAPELQSFVAQYRELLADPAAFAAAP